jgi:hypothetical protein
VRRGPAVLDESKGNTRREKDAQRKKVPGVHRKRTGFRREQPPNEQRGNSGSDQADASTAERAADENGRVEENPDVRLDQLPEKPGKRECNERWK